MSELNSVLKAVIIEVAVNLNSLKRKKFFKNA